MSPFVLRVHKALCKAKGQGRQIPGQGKQEPVFSCLLLRHPCVSQNPVGITDTSDRKPLRSLSLFPGCREGITSSRVVFWHLLVLTFACITFCFQFYYVNMFQKIKKGCVNLFWFLNVSSWFYSLFVLGIKNFKQDESMENEK